MQAEKAGSLWATPRSIQSSSRKESSKILDVVQFGGLGNRRALQDGDEDALAIGVRCAPDWMALAPTRPGQLTRGTKVCAAAIVGGIWADSWPLITPTVGGGHRITVGGDSVDELVEPPQPYVSDDRIGPPLSGLRLSRNSASNARTSTHHSVRAIWKTRDRP